MDSMNKRDTLRFIAGVKYKGEIYFSALKMNGLFSFDPKTGKTNFISLFEEEYFRYFMHSKAFLYQDEMWLVPLEAKHIACVNLTSMNISYVDIPNQDKSKNVFAFFNAIKEGRYLYLIPYYIDEIVRVDMIEHTSEVLYRADFLAGKWATGGFVVNDVLYVTTFNGEIGLKIDIKTGECIYHKDAPQEYNYQYSFQIQEDLWLSPYHANAIRKIPVHDVETVSDIALPSSEKTYYRGMALTDEIVFFPCEDNRQFLFFDKKNNRCIDNVQVESNDAQSDLWYEISALESDDGFFASSILGSIFEFCDNHTVKTYRATLNDTDREEMVKMYNENGMLEEAFDSFVIEESWPMLGLSEMLSLYRN